MKYDSRALSHPLITLACVLLVASAGSALTLDLADIVGGGDGTGTGGNAGIDVTTGQPITVQATWVDAPSNVFVPAANPFVDGVFVPDGTGGAVITVSSTGVTVTGVSASADTQTWDHLWNGLNTGVTTNHTGSILGAHAAKGITFDLDAIEAAYSDAPVLSADLTAAIGDNDFGEADFYVFLDGVLAASTSIAQSPDGVSSLGSIAIGENERFLTLIVTAAGSIGSDWTLWLDPTLTIDAPEPTATAMLAVGAGLLAAIGSARRRRS